MTYRHRFADRESGSQTAKQKDLPQRNHFEPLVEDEKLNKLTDRQKRANRQTQTDRYKQTDIQYTKYSGYVLSFKSHHVQLACR